MSRIQQVETLFHNALQLPPGACRISWIEEQCDEDRDLLEEVRSLLDSH
jgi:hypothetical protein